MAILARMSREVAGLHCASAGATCATTMSLSVRVKETQVSAKSTVLAA